MVLNQALNQAKRLICRIENRLPFSDTKIEIWETGTRHLESEPEGAFLVT